MTESIIATPSANLFRHHPAITAAIFIVTLLSMGLFPPQECRAAEPVSARYLGVSGDTVRLRLTISSPAPQNIILEQYLPAGAKLVTAAPPARQARNSGVVKWLFKRVSPGAIDVSMQVMPPAAARNVSGTLRYRLPESGKMREVPIR